VYILGCAGFKHQQYHQKAMINYNKAHYPDIFVLFL